MLVIDNISKTYANGVHALNSISLTIPNGLFGLLGPNGAGKSSLMRTIAGLQTPDSGSITLDGIDVLNEKDSLRQRLGYLPQDFGLYPQVNPLELLNHFALLKGVSDKLRRKEMVEHLLHQTNLWDVRKKALGTFSGGMRQRFGIAQALIGSPRLVIVDEPTAGLDPDERNRFLNLLSEIGEQVVVILSTHIVADVMDLCPNMAILSKGKVLVQGAPQEAIDALNNKIWRRTISKSSLIQYQQEFQVLSTRMIAGETQIKVYSHEQPDPSFTQISPDLEDLYFFKLSTAHHTTGEMQVQPVTVST